MLKRSLAFYLASLAFGCSGDSATTASLDPPPEGEGFQYETQDISVPFGTEEQDCYFFKIPGEGTDPVYINKFEVAQNEGSHHMNIFRVKTILELDPANGDIQTASDGVGPCADSVNWADWPLIVNSQESGYLDWKLPEGVAESFVPGEVIMLQSHYVNAVTQQTPTVGHVKVNFWTMPAAEVRSEVGTLFATKQSIRVCESNPEPAFDGSCHFSNTEPIHIIGANSHFHSRGKQFDLYTWDGVSLTRPPDSDHFYQSLEWDEPPMARSPELDAVVPVNGGIWYTCEYEWKNPPGDLTCSDVNAFDATYFNTPSDLQDCCYTFGNSTQLAEHCNVFVYYYPKVDNINCF
ncbi:MAG TPA: hypothetical protein VI895_01110 [Bdellovibrionota bacterium]|nr:hypothetical protein [Bdellovibrionota bacterium]